MHIEPVGRLHLERLTMVPAGIERGELLYSVPLAPAEVVNISHKEWSTQSEEFEKIVQDVFEKYSEEGVAEKKELSQATNSQQRHDSAYSLSGSYSYAGSAKVNFSYKRSAEDQEAEQASRKTSSDTTHKASTRTTSDHKYSFKVESAYGSEDQTVRRIENPSKTEATRLDYYQMVRKWRVDLYRYDVRLTYDMVIPSPGALLSRQLAEIRDLDKKLDEPFVFSLRPQDITPDTWEEYEAEFGGRISPPLVTPKPVKYNEAIEWRSHDESSTEIVKLIQIPIGQDYEVTSGHFTASYGRHNDQKVELWVAGEHNDYTNNAEGVKARTDSPLRNRYGLSGDIPILYAHRFVSFGMVTIDLTISATAAAISRWQNETWRSFRDSAEEHYFQARQVLTERRERLLDELNQWDSLTLREMEREAIMRGVIQWILGPDFKFGAPGLTEVAGEDVAPDSANWIPVLEYGEFTKFIHNAIEWENVLFFLYPYFWTAPESDFKLFLKHPDSRHREFLRAGSARVVLTVRPGYEVEFTTLLETGFLTPDPNTPVPYLSIAEEIQNFAKTNYPGIPPANPPNNYRTLLYPEQKAAWRDLQRLAALLEAIRAHTGAFPAADTWFDASKAEAATLEANGESDPFDKPWNAAILPAADPWGNEWIYRSPGTYGDYDLATYGADGEPGGEDLDADITTWAEASLIGRWYEYTPTSALDITLNTALSDLA